MPDKTQDNEPDGGPQPQAPLPRPTNRLATVLGVLGLVILAVWPRFDRIGDQSYWYDEVVTVSVAHTAGIPQFFDALKKLDATRAPLHPLVLSAWIRMFGESEATTRTLSAFCGLITIGLIFAIARRLGGQKAGWWAAVFAALSPLLVQYDRETRMYSLLTVLSSVAWWNFLRFRDSATIGKETTQVVILALLAYVHPLGLLMIAALAIGWLIDRQKTHLSSSQWLTVHGLAFALVLPWLGNYFDHPPEFLSPDVGLKHWVGMPIGFTGGNRWSLAVYWLVILGVSWKARIGIQSRGLVRLVRWTSTLAGQEESSRAISGRTSAPQSLRPLFAYLLVPPTLLFLYSRVSHPIFGPARYNVFVAPAWMILIGCGLARMRRIPSFLIGLALLTTTSIPAVIEAHQERTKADWRLAAKWLDTHAFLREVDVVSPTDGKNFEYVVARYYLGNLRDVRSLGERSSSQEFRDPHPDRHYFYSVSLRDGRPLGRFPTIYQHEGPQVRFHDFRGTLRLIEVNEFLSDPETIKKYHEASESQ